MIILPADKYTPDAENGAFQGIPFEVYQKHFGINCSTLTPFSRSPLDAKRMIDGAAKRETTDAMEWGRLAHAQILEGVADYYTKPETYGPENKKWNGNATECKAWLAAHADKPVLSAHDAAKLDALAAYVRTHPKAGPLVTGGKAELSCFAHDNVSGMFLKGRFDYVQFYTEYTSIIDLKTTQDASTAEFAKTIVYRRYHVQAAMYRRIALALGAPAVRYFFLAVESGPLVKVNVRELNPRAIDRGDEILEGELERYAGCRESGIWPEWSDDAPGISCIDLPEWAYPEPVLEGMTKA